MVRHAPVPVGDGTFCYSGPECKKHGDRHKLLQDVKAHLNTNPLATEKPVDIDTELGRIYNEYYLSQKDIPVILTDIKEMERRSKPTYRYYREDDVARLKERIEEFNQKIVNIENTGAEILAKAAPFEAEFSRRGGWTRAFLVENNGGHVHKSMNCSTCYPTTQFIWLPEYSGGKEEDVVAAAGKQACSTCYPSAPVETRNRPSKIVNPLKEAARQEREAAKHKKQAEAAAKGITSPDGSPLYIESYYGVVKTERTAEIEAVKLKSDLLAAQEGISYMKNEGEYADKMRADYSKLVAALAAKRGVSEDEIEALVLKKGTAKFNKEWKS